MIGMEIDTRYFEESMALAAKYTSQTTADMMNRYCLDVIIASAQAIKKADRAKMEKQLYGLAEVSVLTSSGKFRKKPQIRQHAGRLIYNIINARRRKSHLKLLVGEEMSRAADKMMKARFAAIGYIAYGGFWKACLAFGGRGFGNVSWRQLNERSRAAGGYGRKARHDYLVAEFVNRATGAAKVGGAIVQSIVNQKAYSIEQHVEEKLAKQFERL